MKSNNTQKFLLVIVVLQGMFIAGQWLGQTPAQAARGEMTLPDPGARQLQMVDELKTLNAKMDTLTALLSSGEIKVKVEKDEK